jgi:hypothetical protein
MPRRDDVEVVVVGRGLREGAGSFCGGAGGASGPDGGVAAPKGPRGSSTASKRVDCVPYCRLRGPRAAGDRGAADALGTELAVALEEDWESETVNLGALCKSGLEGSTSFLRLLRSCLGRRLRRA